ncbi:hypothetical protein JZ751_017134 [Albula glossodonta]|uniref:Uncharacterized protein n=1 Tax=Albula glossodonta TaxID=121402 RepID=A0A8T2NPY3_9TELE|nr:hypothetical protein JZ751_017134 [Albula glossodonta]
MSQGRLAICCSRLHFDWTSDQDRKQETQLASVLKVFRPWQKPVISVELTTCFFWTAVINFRQLNAPHEELAPHSDALKLGSFLFPSIFSSRGLCRPHTFQSTNTRSLEVQSKRVYSDLILSDVGNRRAVSLRLQEKNTKSEKRNGIHCDVIDKEYMHCT